MAEGDGEGDDQSGVFSRLNVIEKLVTIAGAAAIAVQTVVTFSTSAETSKITNKISQLDIELKAQAENRERSKDYADIAKNVFEAIKEIQADGVERSDRIDRLSVVSAYVQVIPDLEVRSHFRASVVSLLETLKSQIAAESIDALPDNKVELKQQSALLENLGIQLDGQERADKAMAADEAASKAAEGQTPVPKAKEPDWSNYDFDIFWCQTDNAQLNARAQTIAASIHKIGANAKGSWRLRPLPALTNAQSGYGATGYEIRISSSDENAYAKELELLGNQVLARYNISQRFRLYPTRQDTRWYLSVFICPR